MLKDSKNWRKRFHMVLKYFNNKVNSQMGIFGAFFSMWNYFGEITAIDALHYLVQWMTQCYIVISCYNSQLHFLYNTNESIGNCGVTQCDTDVPLGLNVTHWCSGYCFNIMQYQRLVYAECFAFVLNELGIQSGSNVSIWISEN